MTHANRIAKTALLAALAVSIACGVAACKRPNDPKAAADKKAKAEDVKKEKIFLSPVVVQKVTRGEIRSAVATTGSVVPTHTVMLRAEEAGRLTFTRLWKEGEPVKAGTLIATMRSETLEAELAANVADVQIQKESILIGKKSLDAAVKEYRTLQDLYSRGIAALKDVDNAKLQMDRAINSQRQNEINLIRAKARESSTRERFERLNIMAPFDGLILARSTVDGQGKMTRSFGSETITDYDGRLVGQEFGICGVADISKVIMRCDVTSKDVGRVAPGQPAIATVYAREDFSVEGVLQDISSSVDSESRAFRVDVLLDNKDGRLKPGMFGKVDIVTERRRDTIAIPKSVVSRRNNQNVVFVATKPKDASYEVAMMQNVETGLEGKEDIEVTFGLKTNDRLVVKGFEVLQNSTPISTIDLDAPTTGTQ